ncbi:hypothetical protein [Chryseobacterium sp.]|uniref:hypothetical protein n=1 Tax=Chryseobacterium sp. TaxID=1871047 RepID=UPI002355914E|nr:hypothetical protein [Chryseobacterium sp.]
MSKTLTRTISFLIRNCFYDKGARFYMSDLGIFGQDDLLNAATLDPYDYAYNNPKFYLDSTGLFGRA